MRAFRTAVSVFLLLLGASLAVAAVLDTQDGLALRLVMVLCGILLVEAGAWRRSNPFLPCERRNHLLRAEVDGLIGLVRLLESSTRRARASGTPEHWAEALRIHERLHESVERMKEMAGRRKVAVGESGGAAALHR